MKTNNTQKDDKMKCKQCNKDFKPKKHNESICSDECRYERKLEANRRRFAEISNKNNSVEKECEVCKSKYFTSKLIQRFCSQKCCNKHHSLKRSGREKAQIEKTCKQCGVSFSTENNKRVYCSEECSKKGRIELVRISQKKYSKTEKGKEARRKSDSTKQKRKNKGTVKGLKIASTMKNNIEIKRDAFSCSANELIDKFGDIE